MKGYHLVKNKNLIDTSFKLFFQILYPLLPWKKGGSDSGIYLFMFIMLTLCFFALYGPRWNFQHIVLCNFSLKILYQKLIDNEDRRELFEGILFFLDWVRNNFSTKTDEREPVRINVTHRILFFEVQICYNIYSKSLFCKQFDH